MKTKCGTDFRWRYSTVARASDVLPTRQATGWAKLAKRLCGLPQVRPDKDGPAFIAARFGEKRNGKGHLRHDANVTSVTAVVLDLDHEPIPEARLRAVLAKTGWLHVAYTTYSSTREAPRWRVVVPFDRPLPRRILRAAIDHVAKVTGLKRDTCCDNLSRLHYLPAVPSHKSRRDFRAFHGGERPLRATDFSAARGSVSDTPKRAERGSIHSSNRAKQRESYTVAMSDIATVYASVAAPITITNVVKLFRNRPIALAVARHLDLPPAGTKTQPFTSPLPWRKDAHPSAYLLAEKDGRVVLYDHGDKHGKVYGLEQYAAVRAYGTPPDKRSRVEHILWRVRLLHEVGALRPPKNDQYLASLPPCPEDATKAQRKGYEGFKLLLVCKQCVSEWAGDPTPLAREFFAAWCGFSPDTANKVRAWLSRRGLLHITGKFRGRTLLHAPGPGTPNEEIRRRMRLDDDD